MGDLRKKKHKIEDRRCSPFLLIRIGPLPSFAKYFNRSFLGPNFIEEEVLGASLEAKPTGQDLVSSVCLNQMSIVSAFFERTTAGEAMMTSALLPDRPAMF